MIRHKERAYGSPAASGWRIIAALAVLIAAIGGNAIAASSDGEFHALMDRAQNEIKAADWTSLVRTAERLCALRTDNIWANYYRGLALTNSGRSAEGEEWLKKAIAIDNTVFWPHYMLFFNYFNRGRPEMHAHARNVMQRITPALIQSNPRDIRIFYVVYAGSLINGTDMNGAQAVLQKGIGFFPKDPILRSQYAFTFFRRDMKTWERLSRETLSLIPHEEQTARGTYALPLRGSMIKVHQGNNETISHLGLLNGYDWDFVRVDERGAYGRNVAKKEGHAIFGAIVYAAADGVVYFVEDSSPDTEPMRNHPTAAPNRIIIQHPNGEMTSYIHLMRGSAQVKPGDAVKRGQPIARVGASGSTVDIPHLHFGVSRNEHSVETKLTGFELLRNGLWSDPGPRVLRKNDIVRRK
ncbi:MAG TPA: M23 family metallopeptidase [Spirochaetota bacterium]|nr:M23 family metallopeptidase [Spirochaetota bacterium]HNT12685.1 M23 family metallopeptidase [Spirochaetota bacterium]